MEPTDPPPPTPQTWAETSAWAPAFDPAPTAGEPSAPAAWTPPPAAISQPPTAADYAPPSAAPGPGRAARRREQVSRSRSGARWLVMWALIAEVVIIAIGCNQWVTKKVLNYSGQIPKPGFAHAFVYSTQTFAWRVTKSAGEDTSMWASSLVRIAVVLAVTAVLIALLVRAGSFWRAGIGAALIVVFATQVGVIAASLTHDTGSSFGFSSYAPLNNNGVLYGGGTTTGHGRVTQAVFGAPDGYRFVGGVLLGVLVGIVVGIVARRSGEDRATGPAGPAAQVWPSQAFFPPGQMQRTYETNASPQPPQPQQRPLAPPGSFVRRPDDDGQLGSGRHSIM